MGEKIGDINIFTVINGWGFSSVTLLAIILMVFLFSSYVRIVTVLGILRTGLGVGSLPSAFITGGLAATLSFFVMFPTLRTTASAIDQSLHEKGANITDEARASALGSALTVWKGFLVKHTDKAELTRFAKAAVELEGNPKGQTADPAAKIDSESWRVVAPAFLVSELKIAFATGLSLFLPFLIIDLLVATMITAVGMENLNAVVIAFPFKLLLFVLVDGWALITTNLVGAYITG